MADIRPVLEELKGKFPGKEEIIEKLASLDVPGKAEKVLENPLVQNLLKHDVTEQTMLKLKEVMPNQEVLDKVDNIRKSFIKE